MPTPPIVFPLIHGKDVPIPAPLAGTLDAIQSMVTTMDEQEAEELRDRIVRRVINLLQDSGVSREYIDEEAFERSMNGLTSDSFPVVKAKVRGFYEHVMRATTVPPRATFIFPVAIRSELEYRLAMNILRSSPNFTSLRDEKIWTMTDDTLISRLTLANTCARETTWHDVLRHVLGFRNPDAVSMDVIRTDVLRDFLADYVFGIGRTVSDKEVGALHPRTSPKVIDSGEGQKGSTSIISLKGVRISSELPPLTHISELTGVETEVFELRYGYDGMGDKSSPESYNICVGITPEEIDKRRGKVGAFQTLQRIMIKLFGDELKREHGSSERRHKDRTRWIPQIPRARREEVIHVATRPQHTAIDKVQDYPALITWLIEEEKIDIANKTTSLRSVFLNLRKRKLSQLFSETKILESFVPASLGRQVLLLARFLDTSKTLAQFLEDVYASAQMGKPVQTSPKEIVPMKPALLSPAPVVSTTRTGNGVPGLSSPSKPSSPSISKMTPAPASASSISPFKRDTRYYVPRSGQRHGHTGAWKSSIARTPSPASLPPASAKPVLVPEQTVISKLPEKKSEVPESVIDLHTAGDWLRAQAQWATIFPTLEKKDDLAIALYLQGHDTGLLDVLVELKKKLHCTSTALVASVNQKSHKKEILEQEEIAKEASPMLHITPEHEQKVKTMFTLHQAGKYREFYQEYHTLNGTPTFDEIREVASMLGSDKDTLDAIAFIAGADMPADQKNLYAQYTWDKNLRNFPHVKTVCERLLGKGSDAKKFAVIAKDLDLTVRVPIDRTEWLGFEAKIASEGTTLLQIVEGLVKLDGGDPASTKQILRKVKLILGRTD